MEFLDQIWSLPCGVSGSCLELTVWSLWIRFGAYRVESLDHVWSGTAYGLSHKVSSIKQPLNTEQLQQAAFTHGSSPVKEVQS